MVLASAVPCLAEAPLALGDIQVATAEATVGKEKGNKYLRLSFTATPSAQIEEKMLIRVTATVYGGGQKLTDDGSSIGNKLEAIPVGQSKQITLPLFRTEGLSVTPEKISLSFRLTKLMAKEGTSLGEFCWNGTSAEPGACSE
jgi:hypothetical protein